MPIPLTLSNAAAQLLVAQLKALLRDGREIDCTLRLQQIYSDGFHAGVEAYYARLVEANKRQHDELHGAQPNNLRAPQSDEWIAPAHEPGPAPIVAPASRERER